MSFDNYTTDVFRVWYYKRIPCVRKDKHEWAACTFAHPGERANRRDPRTHGPAMCQELEKHTGDCPLGDVCPNAHSVFESWLHPLRYRTTMCSDAQACTRNLCFFAHSQEELRTDTSIPAVPEGYDNMLSKHHSPGPGSSTSRHHHQHNSSHNNSHGSYQHAQRSSSGAMQGSAAVANYNHHGGGGSSSSAGGAGASAQSNHIGSPYLAVYPFSAAQQARRSGSDGGSSSAQQGRAAASTAASPSAAAAAAANASLHGLPGFYAMPGAMPVMPVPATYAGAIPYAGATGVPAAVYMPGPTYAALQSSSSSNGNTQANSKMLSQHPQRQGTGVYVHTGTALAASSHAGGSMDLRDGRDGYHTAAHQQQQWPKASRGNGSSVGGSQQARSRQQQHTQRRVKEASGFGPEAPYAQRPAAAEEESAEEHEVHGADAGSTAADDQVGTPVYTSAVPFPLTSRVTGSSVHAAQHSLQPAAAATASCRASALQHNNGSMQQLAAALGKVGSPYRHQHGAAAAAPADADAEAKVEKMRDMLRAALMELSAVRGKAQAAEARLAAAESYMTKAALRSLEAATPAAAGSNAASSKAICTADDGPPAEAAASGGDATAAPAEAAAEAAAAVVPADEAARESPGDDAAVQPAAAAAATASEEEEATAVDPAAAAGASTTAAAAAAGDDGGDGVALNALEASLLPVSIVVLPDSQLMVPLPKAMTPGDVGSIVRAAMLRSGANELQVRTADVIMQAQLVQVREAQAEMQAVQAQLMGARKSAQAATGDRDKLEVKYRTYKAALRQQLAANDTLQHQLQSAEDEAREARESAAKALAVVPRGLQDGVGSWADAVSDSEDEAGVKVGAAAGVEQVSADGMGAGKSTAAANNKA